MVYYRLRFVCAFFFLFLFIAANANAEVSGLTDDSLNSAVASQPQSSVDSTDSVNCGNHTKQKDVIDLIQSLGLDFHYTAHHDTVTRKTGRVHVSAIPAVGYTLSTRFAAIIGSNAAFYTDESPNANLSVINLNPVYSQNKQFILPLQSNIWSVGNKFDFVGDWRYYKYPELTYGLGGHTTVNNPDSLDYSYFLFHETVLKSIAPDFFAGVGYDLDHHWNITESGQGVISYFQNYSNASDGVKSASVKPAETTSSGITLNFLYDKRRNSINPPKGFYADVIFRANNTVLGSDQNWQSLIVDMRKYFKLSACSDNVLAIWSYTWLTLNGTPPYLDLPSTGWDAFNNTGRGYIQSRLRGRDFVYLESEYRFGITANGLLGGVVFANAESVSESQSGDFDTVLPAVGAGIRFKINKHSNTNIALDYGFGTDGSKGAFVNLGEVF